MNEEKQIVISDSVLKAVATELKLLERAIKFTPNTKLGEYKDCACMGPLPKCLCMQQKEEIQEFIDIVDNL